MEKREFIAAKDLPVTNANELFVMCVEDGEMVLKKIAPETETTYDIKVRFTFTRDEDNNTHVQSEILSGSYDAVMQKLDNGELPVALVIVQGQVWEESTTVKNVYEYTPYYQEVPGESDFTGLVFDEDRYIILHSDGTCTLD